MHPERQDEITVTVSAPASPQPQTTTVPTAAVPLDVLRKYSSPKPLRQGPNPPAQPRGGKGSSD
jgi:hypothetical protein